MADGPDMAGHVLAGERRAWMAQRTLIRAGQMVRRGEPIRLTDAEAAPLLAMQPPAVAAMPTPEPAPEPGAAPEPEPEAVPAALRRAPGRSASRGAAS